jgi:hypothetical protein
MERCKQLYFYLFVSLCERQIPWKAKITKFHSKNNLNTSVKEVEFNIKNFPRNKSSCLDYVFIVLFCQMNKHQFCIIFEKNFPAYLTKHQWPWCQTHYKKRKEKKKTISFMNTSMKILFFFFFKVSKSNTATSRKDNTSWPSGVYPGIQSWLNIQ